MPKPLGKIVFFGSGPVAKASLDALNQCADIEAIITKPSTLLEMTAGLASIPVHTVSTKAESSELFAQRPFTSELGIIVDFGIIIEQPVIDYFPFGIINSHFSMLPEWRGADPISFSILSGQPETGVSLQLINDKLDEGMLIAQETQPISPNDTTDSLTAKLVALSSDMLERHVPAYRSGKRKTFAQPSKVTPTYSRKLSKSDGIIDWSKPAAVLEREVRAYQPWPKSTTQLGGIDVTLLKVAVDTDQPTASLTSSQTTESSPASTKAHQPGSIVLVGKSGLTVYCGQDALRILELKPANGKAMPIAAFLAGHRQKFL